MRQAAADSAAFADRVMRHMGDGSGKQRMRSRESRIRLDVAPAHPCAEVNAGIVDLNRVETRDAAEIDQQCSGAARRNARMGTRLWPPASSFAVPLPAARSATASCTVVGLA